MSERRILVNVYVRGGHVRIDKAEGPLFIGCAFDGVHFDVSASACANDKPLFENCHLLENCTGQIAHSKLGEPTPEERKP